MHCSTIGCGGASTNFSHNLVQTIWVCLQDVRGKSRHSRYTTDGRTVTNEVERRVCRGRMDSAGAPVARVIKIPRHGWWLAFRGRWGFGLAIHGEAEALPSHTVQCRLSVRWRRCCNNGAFVECWLTTINCTHAWQNLVRIIPVDSQALPASSLGRMGDPLGTSVRARVCFEAWS